MCPLGGWEGGLRASIVRMVSHEWLDTLCENNRINDKENAPSPKKQQLLLHFDDKELLHFRLWENSQKLLVFNC